METAEVRAGLCRVLVVNRIDAEPGKLGALIAQLREEFGPGVPADQPAGEERQRVVDCFFSPTGDSDVEDVGAGPPAHQRPGGGDQRDGDGPLPGGRRVGLSGQELHDAFEQCLREGHLVPICFVVRAHRRRREGVCSDLAEKLFPSPLEGNPPAVRARQRRVRPSRSC
jgi:elongation factor G